MPPSLTKTGISSKAAFTGEKFEGRKTVSVKAALDEIPVFVKDGGIIPTAEGLMSTKDSIVKYNVLVFGAADSRLTLYDDDGVTNDYKKGIFEQTDIEFLGGKIKICDKKGSLSQKITIIKK